MMLMQELMPGVFTEWHPTMRINRVLYQPNIEAVWDDEKLASIGLMRLMPFVTPKGHERIGGREFVKDGAVLKEVYQTQPIAVTSFDVNKERDRRMQTFSFAGKIFGLRMDKGELANVSGAGTLSLAAIVNGAQPGNLRWANPDADFGWIAEDNTLMPMDAQTTWAFASAGAAHRQKVIFAARVIKDMSPIPVDYADGTYWLGA